MIAPTKFTAGVLSALLLVASVTKASDLSLDLQGRYEGYLTENCVGWMAGVFIYAGIMPDIEYLWSGGGRLKDNIDEECAKYESILYRQSVFQDCQRLTITSGNGVYHMIVDGEFVTDDWQLGIPFVFQSEIEEPTPEEAADGATSVLSLYLYNELTGGRTLNASRRYVNSAGQQVITQDAAGLSGTLPNGNNYTTKGKLVLDKVNTYDLCTPYDPDSPECSDRVYPDESRNWTVACCEAYGGDDVFLDLIKYPRPPEYGGQIALGYQNCTVP